jgi:hypothetical protein
MRPASVETGGTIDLWDSLRGRDFQKDRGNNFGIRSQDSKTGLGWRLDRSAHDDDGG